MNNFNQQVIGAFFKATLVTTLIFGTLLAQSWATSALFAEHRMKMNIEFTATADAQAKSQKASMSVHNEQESSIAFGDHQLNIKTTFVKWAEEATDPEEVFAEIVVLKRNAEGLYSPTHTPKFMLGIDQWAEFKIDANDNEDGIELKMQFEDFIPMHNEHGMYEEPVWLNWSEKQSQLAAC